MNHEEIIEAFQNDPRSVIPCICGHADKVHNWPVVGRKIVSCSKCGIRFERNEQPWQKMWNLIARRDLRPNAPIRIME